MNGRIQPIHRFSVEPLLLVLIAAGAAIRLLGVDQDLWVDEHLAVSKAGGTVRDLTESMIYTETNPPLYFVVALAWERLFGDTDAGFRILSIAFGTATIPVVYMAARELANGPAALAAAAITAFSPYTVWYSQEVRPYPLVLLLAALSFLCFAKLISGRDRRWLWGWAITSSLALATHYFGALLVAGEAVALAVLIPRLRAELALATAAIACVGVALAPLALAQQGLTAWISEVPLADRLAQAAEHPLAGMTLPWPPLAALLAVAVGGLAAFGAWRGRASLPRGAVVAAALVAGCLAVVVAAAAVGSDYLTTRNLIVLWTPFAIALAAVLVGPGLGRVGPIAVVAICAFGAGASTWTAFEPHASRPDWGPVADAIGEAPPDGRVILSSTGFVFPVTRYLEGEARASEPGEVLPPTADIVVLEPRSVPDYSIGPCWWIGLCGGSKVVGAVALPYEVPPEFRLVDEAVTDVYTVRHFVAREPVQLPATGFGGVDVQMPS